MRVKFKKAFFAASEAFKRGDGRVISGKLYRAGIHDNVPDDMKLPDYAEILDKTPAAPLPVPGRNPIHEADGERAASDAIVEATKKAEVQRDANGKVKRGRGRPRKYA